MLTLRLAKCLLCLAPVWGASAIFSRDWAYNESEARMFASLSSAPYCDDKRQLLNWTCQACKDSKTPLVPGKIHVVDSGLNDAVRIIVGKLRDQNGCVMVFRGSKYHTNWFQNLRFWPVTPKDLEDCPGCKVHSGFSAMWTNVRKDVMAALQDVGCAQNGTDNLIYVTGHSLGGALTHLAMFALHHAGFEVAKTYSFEAPRTGNKVFAETFANSFASRSPVFRITHHMDPIVHMPPEALGYQHVQTEVYYNFTQFVKVCSQVEDPSCANQFTNVAAMLLNPDNMGDHCSSPLLPNWNYCWVEGCESKPEVIV